MLEKPDKDIRQGDIVKELAFANIKQSLPAVCVTPACDVAIQPSGKLKADYVAFCPVLEEGFFFSHLKNLMGNKFNKGVIQEIISGKNIRYFPIFSEEKECFYIVDFQLVQTVTISSIAGIEILHSLKPPFGESLASKYGSYMGRIGTPDLKIDRKKYSKELNDTLTT